MKKISAFALVLLLLFSLTACESSKRSPEPTPPPKTAQSEALDTDEVISRDVVFYFPDDAVMYLVGESRNVNLRESLFLESVVQAIIKGPANESLRPSISGDVEVLSVTEENGICTVDLSSEFAEFNTGGSTKETMAIYSIVNTLCSIDEINKVKINIDGNENPDFGGHFSLDEPLEADMSLIKE